MAKTSTKHRGIVQLGTNRYEIRVRATCPRTGRRKEVRREEACTLREARVLQQQWRIEMEQELVAVGVPRVRLRDFAPSWLRGRIEAGDLKPSSAAKIASVYDVHIAPDRIADLFIDDITPMDIEAWIDGQRRKRYAPGKGPAKNRKAPQVRPYAAGAIRGHYRVLRTILTAAAKRARVMNPCDAVDTPAARPRRGNYLTREELSRVLDVVERDAPDWYAAVLLDAFTGLRWGELSALRWDDIDEEAEVIRVVRGNFKGEVVTSTKTGEEGEARIVPLLPAVAEVLRAHKARQTVASPWIFPTKDGELHKGSPLRKVIPKACLKAGIERRVTPHGLRHTANDLLRRVADGEVVRAIIGHSTEQMTHHYSHVDEREKRAATQRAFEAVSAERGGKGVPEGVAGWVN